MKEKNAIFQSNWSFALFLQSKTLRNLLVIRSFSHRIWWVHFEASLIVKIMQKISLTEKSHFFPSFKKIEFFNVFYDFPNSFLSFSSQKNGSKNVQYIQFCRARRALSNYVKISKKKLLLQFWNTGALIFYDKKVWHFWKLMKFDTKGFR